MKKIYLAGPMTGYQQYNFHAFITAEEVIKALGWQVISPARMDIERGFNPIENPNAVFTDDMLTEAIRRNVDAILECQAIAMMDGWANSKGATAEFHIAQWAGVELFRYYSDRQHLLSLCATVAER